ncbi:MAG: proline racemase family protein, partial [Oscillospiraceae bacterium]
LVTVTEPYTYITLDTAAGLVKVKVEVKDGVAKRVTFANAPAFVMEKDVVLKTQEYGDINMNIAYGGNVYGILPSSAVGLKICPENAKEIIKRGLIIKKYLNEQVKVCHPEMPFINKVTHIEFSDEPDAPIENSLHIKNAVVIPPCAIDRSPCGTGTSAKMALLYSQGKLKKGDTFIHESIIGSLFHCQILDEAEVCGIPAIIPEVSGCAYVTGTCTFYIDPDDPFPEGFELN